MMNQLLLSNNNPEWFRVYPKSNTTKLFYCRRQDAEDGSKRFDVTDLQMVADNLSVDEMKELYKTERDSENRVIYAETQNYITWRFSIMRKVNS